MSNNKHNYMKIKDTINSSLKSEKFNNLLQYCQQNGVLFVDKEFPPDKSSLIGSPPAQDYNGQFDNIQWKRAAELFGDNYDIFKGISPNDIVQGSLASLAEYPSLISRLFDFDHCNEYGIQAVWLNINGIWKQIILDEYFPSHHNGRNWDLAFSKTDQKELWVILLEKAYAKAYGSYWEIIGGDPVHALRDLTGAPYDRIEDFDDLDAAWAKMKSANSKEYMLTCFTYSTDVVEERSKVGLAAGHAYTILDVRNIIDSQGRPQRILQIRNPWGQFEWNGDFSDSSPLWTPQLRQKLGVQQKDDGVFWMRLEDFKEHFQGVGILEIIPGAQTNGLQVKNEGDDKLTVIRLEVKEDTNMMFSIDQKDSRFLDNPNYSYSYFRVTIGKVIGNKGLQYIDCIFSPERNIFLENKLDQGNYIVLVEAYWSNDVCREFNVGTYSEGKINMEIIADNPKMYKELEYLIWKNYARINNDKFQSKGTQMLNDYQSQAQIETKKFQSQKHAMMLLSFINYSKNVTAHMSMKISNIVGYDVTGLQADQQSAELIMNPQDNDIVLFKMDPNQQKFGFGYALTQGELINTKFSPNLSIYEMINNLGGVQPTPDNPSPDVLSKAKRLQEELNRKKEEERLEAERRRQRQERKRRLEEKRRREEEELRQQQQQMRNQGMQDQDYARYFGYTGSDSNSNEFGFGSLEKLFGFGRKKKKKRQQKNDYYDPYSQQQGGYNQWAQWGGQQQQSNYGYGYQNQQNQQQKQDYEWDCIMKILFNMDLMKALIEMEDIHCERDVLNFHDLFDQIESKREQDDLEKSSLDKENNEEEQNDIMLNKINEFANENIDIQNQIDYERNLIFDKIQIHPDDYENNAESFEKAFQQKMQRGMYFKDEGVQENAELEINNFGGSSLKIDPTEGVYDNLVWINKIEFNSKFNKSKEKLKNIKQISSISYRFDQSKLEVNKMNDKDISNLDINNITQQVNLTNSFALKQMINKRFKAKLEQNVDETQIELNADLERQEYFVNLDDEINLPEIDTSKINLHNYLVKPIGRMEYENYNKNDHDQKNENHATYYSKLEIIKDHGHNHRLLEIKIKDDIKIAEDFMNYFKLLPPCIQKAIFQYRCTKDYDQIVQGKRNKQCVLYNNSDVRVNLQCNEDETFFNNACYKKCPIGFKDAKIYCMKNKYIKRKIMLYNFQQLNNQKEMLWGSKYILTKCSIYGKYYQSAGSDYCKMLCPKGWKNYGTICKKPFRYLNQRIFVFSQDDIANEN